MNRRTSRLRREYLYRKSLEGSQREEYEKKRAIREALQEGKPIPSGLRKEAADLKRKVDLEDDNTAVQRTHIDDEYGNIGVLDPQVRPRAALGGKNPQHLAFIH
jgi:U3 small nucleolar ribonucleoprotein protein IMP4